MNNKKINNKKLNIILTGSAGCIGAPLAYDLLDIGHKVIGIDNYINSNPVTTSTLKKKFKNFIFYKLDLDIRNSSLNSIFDDHKPDLVLHLAALKSVQDSITNPNAYIKNNIESTKNILDAMKLVNCRKIIFSSSAAVYGNQEIQPVKENIKLKPISTYAKTKLTCEELIMKASDFGYVDGISLRYFNPIGSHSSCLFKQQLHKKNSSIMQEIIKVGIKENRHLKIYGNNYLTEDGTSERDFIHIDDLIDAHISSIDYISSFFGYDVFNVGTGKPITILNLLKSFVKYNKVPINYKFCDEKPGDIVSSYADVSKISQMMKWKSKKNKKNMVIDSWIPYSN